MESNYNVSQGKAFYQATIGTIGEYAGILTGVAGVVDDCDFKKIALGGFLYLGAKGLSRAFQYKIDSQRHEKLEKRVK